LVLAALESVTSKRILIKYIIISVYDLQKIVILWKPLKSKKSAIVSFCMTWIQDQQALNKPPFVYLPDSNKAGLCVTK
jgi:hypothetical protein